MGEADGSIMPVIMTAHIAHSGSKCVPSHRGVVIHALAPVIGPYMSRAFTTVHIQDIKRQQDQEYNCRRAVIP